MRVIAGRFAGIPLQTPRSGTRPTTDRTKEALFSHLDAEGILTPGSWVLDLFAGTGALAFEALSRGADHAVLVDRSPQAVSLIKKAASAIRRHDSWDPTSMSIDVLRLPADKAVDRLITEKEATEKDAAAEAEAAETPTDEQEAMTETRAVKTPTDEKETAETQAGETALTDFQPFDVVFLDPPYALESEDLAALIKKMTSHGLVSDDGEIVIERSTRSQPVALPDGWESGKPKRYGETTVTYVYKA